MSQQISFDPAKLIDKGCNYKLAHAAALTARNKALKKARKEYGKQNAYGWTLTGQLRKYKSFGEPCGLVRNVYYMTVNSEDTQNLTKEFEKNS